MFPREITTTPVWIRHELPLSAPLPPDGDRTLRRQIRSQHPNETDEEINEIVQKERARLNLKWCFDEYFGYPIANPTLGRIVTANCYGNVHLGYIVDITHSSIILISVNTLTVLPAVNPDDIYSAEYSPFYHNYLYNQRIYHPQHILDWWTRSKYEQQHQYTNFSSPTDTLFPMCTDITSDWPVGNEIWFTHDVLPQRNELIQCYNEEILCISTKNIVENAEQHSMLFPDPPLISNDQLIRPIHYSNLHAVTTDQRYNSLVHVNIQDPIITLDPKLSHSNLRSHKQSHRLSFSVFTPGFVRQPGKLILFSVLLIYLITALSHPVKHHVEIFPLAIAPKLALGFLFLHNFHSQILGCSLVLHDINNRDWFRLLAVP